MWTCSLLLFWDVNECADTTTCPSRATCNNTVGSYYCTCKGGFLSSNGLMHFKGPGVTCKDIDECSQRPQPCGPNSVCKNLPGRYTCSCSHGFSSPTGDNWSLGKQGHFSCTDIDECLNSGVCPEHSECVNSLGSYSCQCQNGFIVNNARCEDVDECANPRACPENATCHNSLGSYSCVCSPGFESSTGNISFHVPEGTCEDVDECLDMCPLNAKCINTPGSYFCTCQPGYVSSNGWLNFTDQEVKCRDIDECVQDPSPCGPNSVCINALGSYSCGCIVGFHPNPEGSWKYGNFSCKRVPFKCKEDVIPNNKWVLLCQGGAVAGTEHVPFCSLINTTLSILDEVCANRTTAVSLQSMAERFASVLEQISTWSNLTKNETSTLVTVLLESVESTTLAALLKSSANGSQIIQTEHLDIESKVIKDECTEENVAFNLKAKGDRMNIGCSIIEASESTGATGVAFVSFVGMESVLDKSLFQDPLADSKMELKMNSHVVAGIMTGEKKDGFSDQIIYTLENLQPKQKFERPICVSWSTDLGVGRWTSSGCVVLEASEMHTVCSCNRMANLAIIMASGELTVGCAIIAGFLHYLFLACFFWMLIEAMMLFLMVRNLKVVNYFSSRNIKMLYLCAFAYGVPGLVVLISASVQPQGYGMHNLCWLNTETGFIWSFLGPVCAIILINSILLSWTLCILKQKLSSVNAEVSTLKNTRLLTFKAFAQLFILGCSWVLGIFQIGPVASVMAYLFTIINSLQGAFIFLIHCLLSRQVREEYWRWITRKTKARSQSQTSGILLLSIPSTSKTG
uniref:Adhesion G protein-coupled receptor E1 n=1 Tax=Rhinolophus ferrumequinum TaxID=59479 RepID=A0A671EZM7_RHIFE